MGCTVLRCEYEVTMERRITIPNPGEKKTYRIDISCNMERLEIKIQQGRAFLFGDIVDALGKYEDEDGQKK